MWLGEVLFLASHKLPETRMSRAIFPYPPSIYLAYAAYIDAVCAGRTAIEQTSSIAKLG